MEISARAERRLQGQRRRKLRREEGSNLKGLIASKGAWAAEENPRALLRLASSRAIDIAKQEGRARLPLASLPRHDRRSSWGAIARSLCLTTLLSIDPLLISQTSHPPRPPSVSDVPVLLQAAEVALTRNDFAAAVKALKSVVAVQPQMTSAWFNLAYALSGLHQNAEALIAYQKTLELQPDLFEARLNLGILLIELKKPQASLAHLEKAVALKPQHTRAHLYFGRALSLTGNPDAAEKQFEEVLRLDPALAIAHFDLGQLFLARKRYGEARASFRKAAQLDPRLAPAQLGLALASEGLNDLAEAVTSFVAYLAQKPDDLETRFHLARIYLQQGRNEQALENLQTVYRANPGLPGVAAALGDVFALSKRFDESETYYRKALVATPGEPDLHRALGQTLLDEEKFAEAEGEFRAALKLDPQNQEAAKGLANSLYLEKRYAEALPLFETQAGSPNAPAGLFFVLASCYDHLRDLPRALENYERYLSLADERNPTQAWQARQRVKVLRRELRK